MSTCFCMSHIIAILLTALLVFSACELPDRKRILSVRGRVLDTAGVAL